MSNRRAARRLAERLEVAGPDLLGVGAAPDVPGLPVGIAVEVDRLVAQEVDGADHVVPVAPVEQVGEPVLAAGQEVRLDPDLEPGLVCRKSTYSSTSSAAQWRYQGCVQTSSDWTKRWMCSATPELLDAALAGGLAVAVHVGRGEVALGRRVVLVRAQVHVVVGQHSAASARARSASVVTLMFSGRRLDHPHGPAGGLHERGVVGRGRERRVVHVERAAQRVGAEHLRRLHGPEPGAVERAHAPCRRDRPP